MAMTPTTPAISDLLDAAGLGNLGESPPPEAVEAALRELPRLLKGADPLRVETAKTEAVRRLKEAKVTGATALVKAAFPSSSRADGEDARAQGRAMALTDPEPWPDPGFDNLTEAE